MISEDYWQNVDDETFDPNLHLDVEWKSYCEDAVLAWTGTKNPIYFFQLLARRWRCTHTRVLLTAVDEVNYFRWADVPPDVLKEAYRKAYADFQLPVELDKYMSDLGCLVMHLAKGLDPREPEDIGPVGVEARLAWLETKPAPPLSVRSAASLLPMTFGFTREAGWNAFDEWDRIKRSEEAREAMLWVQSKDRMGGRPAMSPREAREHVMEEYGFTDERAFRRFLAVARRVNPGL